MIIIVLLAALAVAGAIPLLWWSLASAQTPQRTASRNLLNTGQAVPDLRNIVLQQSATDRAVRPFMGRLAQASRRLSPAGWADGLERRLIFAGRPVSWPLERVLAGKLILGVAGLLLGLLYFNGSRTFGGFLMWTAVTALGYFAPDLLLYSKGQERQKVIRNELADTLDQMTIAVEAGLGFDAAMARAGQTGGGPLAEELVRTLQEVQFGVGRSQALRNLADRTDVPDLRHFVLAIVQAEGYGIPIADVLRIQAAEMRVKRRQRAEERAMKIPVKVIFPLVLCILPTLFIVLMGPGMIKISRSLFGANGAFS